MQCNSSYIQTAVAVRSLSDMMKMLPGVVIPYSHKEEAFLETHDRWDIKIASYRHRSNCSSFYVKGKSWQEVYDKMVQRMNNNYTVPF